MHELSIAMSMVEMATAEATRQGAAQVNALHLKLGQPSGVVKEALLFSWEVACEGSPLAGSQLELSAKTGAGMEEWLSFLRSGAKGD